MDENTAWTFNSMPRDLTISGPGANAAWLTFHQDGRVTANPDLQPDEAARQLIEVFVKFGWLKYAPGDGK